MTSNDSRPRILCLHGFRQSASQFYGRTSAFRKCLKNVATLEYLDGPFTVQEPRSPSPPQPVANHPIQDGQPGDLKDPEAEGPALPTRNPRRSWWKGFRDVGYPGGLGHEGIEQGLSLGDRSSIAEQYQGWEESVRLVCDHLATKGPFQGLLGFSQGSSLVLLVCHELCQAGLERLGLRFAMLFSGYKPEILCDSKSPPLNLPSLHMWGKSDLQVTSCAFCRLYASHAIIETRETRFLRPVVWSCLVALSPRRS